MFVKEVSISQNYFIPSLQILNTKYHTASRELRTEGTVFIYHTNITTLKMGTKKSRPNQFLTQRQVSLLTVSALGLWIFI